MKKTCLLFVFLVSIAFLAFSDNEEQQEIDFLLFLPNSSSRFVNEERAGVQLDNLAKYLMSRDLTPGQINVYGYAAFATNAVDPVNFSRSRALFVIDQLQRRGVPRDLFADPVGYGTVDLWGGNTDEAGRNLNRRVRVVLDGAVLIPDPSLLPEPSTGQVIENENPLPTAPDADSETGISGDNKDPSGGSKRKFPWWILLPLFLLLLAILLMRRKKPTAKPAEPKRPEQPKTAPVAASTSVAPPAAPEVTSASVAPPAAPVAASESVVYLEEEIRCRAFDHSLQRNGQNGSMDEDWYKALTEICAKYESDGYQAYKENGCWWARKSFTC